MNLLPLANGLVSKEPTRVVPRCEVKNHSATVVCPRSLLVTQLIFRCQLSLSITLFWWQKEYVLQLLSQWNMEKASGTSILVTTDSTSNTETAFASPNWKHIHCVTHTLDHYRSLQYSKCWHKVAKLFRSFTIGQIKAEREARGTSNSLVYPWCSQWWADRIQLWKSN